MRRHERSSFGAADATSLGVARNRAAAGHAFSAHSGWRCPYDGHSPSFCEVMPSRIVTMTETIKKTSLGFWATVIVASMLFVTDASADEDSYGELSPESAIEMTLLVDEREYRGGPSRVWAVSAFDRIFGVLEFGHTGSRVFIGPFDFHTRLSAPAVASIAAAGLVVLVGLVALAITRLRGKPA